MCNSVRWGLLEDVSHRTGYRLMRARIGSVLARNGAVASRFPWLAAGTCMPPEAPLLVTCGSWWSQGLTSACLMLRSSLMLSFPHGNAWVEEHTCFGSSL